MAGSLQLGLLLGGNLDPGLVAKTSPAEGAPERYDPDDSVLAFLKSL